MERGEGCAGAVRVSAGGGNRHCVGVYSTAETQNENRRATCAKYNMRSLDRESECNHI